MKDYGEELEGRIAAYIDGQLPPAEAARLEVFLANSDPALAKQVVDMIAERNAVRALPKPHAPDDLAARIMEQVERTSLLNDSEHFAAPRRPWWQSRLAVAAALFLILGGFGYFILEAVRRPDSSWRDTVMDESPHRDDSREIASAQKSISPTPPAGITSAPSATALASAAGASGGAAPQKSATALPAAIPDLPAAVTPAQQSAAALAEKSQPTPIEIVLVARTPDDEARLRAELARFSDANPAAANRIALNTTADNQSNVAGTLSAGNANNISPAKSQLAQNNSNAGEQFAARAASRSQQSLQNTRNYQYYDPNRRAFNATPESRSAQNTQNTQSTPTESSAQAPALPYRVALHPDQLRQLTTDFEVQSETTNLSDALAPTAAFGATAAPTTEPQIAAKDLTTRLTDKPADAWIDCIITLLPPPTSTSSSTTEPRIHVRPPPSVTNPTHQLSPPATEPR